MKTLEEIKKGLECCMDYQSCTDCGEPKCPYNDMKECVDALLADASVLIQQLETELAAVRQEKNAAKKDLYSCQPCFACSHFRHNGGACRGANECFEKMGECAVEGIEYVGVSFMWRGVCPENTEVQKDDH